MEFTFADALLEMGKDAGFRMINEARVPADYLFNTLLPERNKPDYHVESGNMTIRTIMAGLAGMSSRYDGSTFIESSVFLGKTAKIANEIVIEEAAVREMQMMLKNLNLRGEARKQFLMQEAFNFYNKVVIQGHYDTFEWLRARALYDGQIDWTYNEKPLEVDYKVPSTHFGTARTGNDVYAGSTSKFWTDHYAALTALRYNVRMIVVNIIDLLQMVNQDANKFEIVAQTDNMISVKRWRSRGNIEVESKDNRDVVNFVAYQKEGEVIDPADSKKTIKIPFAPRGRMLYVGLNSGSAYRVGEGSTPDPMMDAALGYTHIAPTAEGDRQGRWGKIFIPENAEWSVGGKGVTNGLPVREDVSDTEAKTYVLRFDYV